MNTAASEFVISRTFDAQRDLVWKAHTDCRHLMQWSGPQGFKMTECKLDLRPGGVLHYCLRSPDGHNMWGKLVYREVVTPERLVHIISFSDEKQGVTRHPLSPSWPLETLATATFAEQDGRTTLTVRWAPFNATEEEKKTFDSSHDAMRQGWIGTMDQLAEYLAKSQARAG
jgi:uncharacterized protein YndB with AHSA1/START domain